MGAKTTGGTKGVKVKKQRVGTHVVPESMVLDGHYVGREAIWQRDQTKILAHACWESLWAPACLSGSAHTWSTSTGASSAGD